MNNLKKLAVATAVSTAIGVGGMAQANSVFFPFITTAAGSYTFLTVVPDAIGSDGDEFSHDTQNLHFYYGYKAVGAAADDACVHRDYVLSVTDNAILQLEVGGNFNLVTQFNDPPGYGVGFLPVPAGMNGFASVEDGVESGGVSLFGEGVIIDAASGLTTAYSGIQSPDGENPDWTAVGATEFVTSWFPTNIVSTSWYALALGLRSDMTPNAGGGVYLWLRPETDIDSGPSPSNYGAFYRDGNGNNELYVSGTTRTRLRCWGTFELEDLLGDKATVVQHGGWMSVGGYAPDDTALLGFTTTTQPYALWKVQNTSALGRPATVISGQTPRGGGI
jgi:hypothetical protein